MATTSTTFWGRFSKPVRPRIRRRGRGGLTGAWQDAYGSARSANLRRYEDILAGYGQRQQDVMAQLEGVGTAAHADIGRRARGRAATIGQWAVDKGFYGMTPQFGKLTGSDRLAGQEYQGLAEGLGRERAGMLSGLMGDRLGFMERREDAYPDQNFYANLLQQGGFERGARRRRPWWMAYR